MRWQDVEGRPKPLEGERQRRARTRHFLPYLWMQKQPGSELAEAMEVNAKRAAQRAARKARWQGTWRAVVTGPPCLGLLHNGATGAAVR